MGLQEITILVKSQSFSLVEIYIPQKVSDLERRQRHTHIHTHPKKVIINEVAGSEVDNERVGRFLTINLFILF